MQVTIEAEGTSVVLAGNFNPAIFTPHWLEYVGLVDEGEASEATINVVHPDLTSLQFGWFQLIVEHQRCTVNSVNAIGIRVYDFAMRLFGDILPHTPLQALGINYVAHFRVKSIAVLDRLGDTLAPKEPWGTWGKDLQTPTPKDHPNFRATGNPRSGGLRSISMTNYVRPDGIPGYVQAKIEPSLLYRPAAYIEINDHFQLSEVGGSVPAVKALEPLQGKFDSSAAASRALTDHFMEMAERFGYES